MGFQYSGSTSCLTLPYYNLDLPLCAFFSPGSGWRWLLTVLCWWPGLCLPWGLLCSSWVTAVMLNWCWGGFIAVCYSTTCFRMYWAQNSLILLKSLKMDFSQPWRDGKNCRTLMMLVAAVFSVYWCLQCFCRWGRFPRCRTLSRSRGELEIYVMSAEWMRDTVAYPSFHFLIWISFSDNQVMERIEMKFSRAQEGVRSEIFLLFLHELPFLL